MRTLFAISILALIALLWAAFSIARHIRRARRRKRRESAAAPAPLDHGVRATFGDLSPPATVSGLKFEELTPYAEAAVVHFTAPAYEPQAATHPELETLPVEDAMIEEPETIATAEPALMEEEEPAAAEPEAASPVPELEMQPAPPEIDINEHPAAATEPAEEHVVAVEAEEIPPDAETAEPEPFFPALAAADAEVEEPEPEAAAATAASDSLPQPQAPAPKKSFPGFPLAPKPSALHPSSRLARRSTNRPDWAYFNKDMGDLTDPDVSRGKPKNPAGS